MKATPESPPLEFLGVRFGQADGRLNRLSSTTIELRLGQFARGERGNQLQQLRPVFRRKTPNHDLADLGFQRRDELGVCVPKTGDGDTSIEINIAVPITVRESRAFAMR